MEQSVGFHCLFNVHAFSHVNQSVIKERSSWIAPRFIVQDHWTVRESKTAAFDDKLVVESHRVTPNFRLCWAFRFNLIHVPSSSSFISTFKTHKSVEVHGLKKAMVWQSNNKQGLAWKHFIWNDPVFLYLFTSSCACHHSGTKQCRCGHPEERHPPMCS